jgi:hypothetical protein
LLRVAQGPSPHSVTRSGKPCSQLGGITNESIHPWLMPLAPCAACRWQQEEEDLIDDCTAIVAYLDVRPLPAATTKPSSSTSRASSSMSSLDRLSGSKASTSSSSSSLLQSAMSPGKGRCSVTSTGPGSTGKQAHGGTGFVEAQQGCASSPASLAALLGKPALAARKKL